MTEKFAIQPNILYTLSVGESEWNNRAATDFRNSSRICVLSSSTVGLVFVIGKSVTESFWPVSSVVTVAVGVVVVLEDTFADGADVGTSTVLCDTGSTIGNGFLSRLSR